MTVKLNALVILILCKKYYVFFINILLTELNDALKIFNRECKYALSVNAELYKQFQEIIAYFSYS